MTSPSEDRYESGFTLAVYFPAEAPKEMVDRVTDRVAELVYGELLENREGWDPFVFGHARDTMRVTHDCECCPSHVYFSTSCFHGDHNYCQGETGLLGNKVPASCKFCGAPCTCVCHADKKVITVDG